MASFISIIAVNGNCAAGNADLKIEQVGCHLSSDICYVYVDKIVGPSSCESNSVRWQRSTEGSKEVLSLLTAAFVAKKLVVMRISDSCIGTYPTFSFVTLTNE